jgi:hypothetical protein
MKKLVLLLVLSFGAIGRAIAAPADGTWEVRLTGDTGFRCSGDYIIRLTVAQGRLSGVFLGPGGTQSIPNLVLNPDGSFSGTTSGGQAAGGNPLSVFSLSGQLSGDTATVTTTNTIRACGPRTGHGARTGK